MVFVLLVTASVLTALVILQYQNCLRKFFYNTDSQILLYLARTHYEAEQWQDCKKTLLRAIHLAPSNYALRFDAGVVMQKFSALTLQKEKRTADEVSFSFCFFLLFQCPIVFISKFFFFLILKWHGMANEQCSIDTAY